MYLHYSTSKGGLLKALLCTLYFGRHVLQAFRLNYMMRDLF